MNLHILITNGGTNHKKTHDDGQEEKGEGG